MNTSNLQQPRFKTISNLFKDNNYTIPSYQRKYSWTNNEANDLLDDIYQVSSGNEKHHFFGSIVTYTNYHDNAPQQVIDGQQRITTSLVLIATIRDLTNKLDNRLPKSKRNYDDPTGRKIGLIKSQITSILFSNDHPTLKIKKSHVEPQEQKYCDFFNWIITKHGIGINYTDRSYKPIKLLRGVRRTLQRSLSHKIRYSLNSPKKLNPINIQISELYNIFKAFVDNFYVIIMEAPSRAEALTIYMTLNNRGKDLSTADIVKGHLAGVLEDSNEPAQIPVMMHKWGKMSTGLNSNTTTISHFIGEYWGACYRYASGSKLPRDIINTINTPQEANVMVKDLLDLFPVYRTLLDPLSKDVKAVYHNTNIIEMVAILNKLHLVQYYPVLIAMYHHRNRFNEDDVLRILSDISSIEMRHMMVSVHHTIYSSISNKIWNNKLLSVKDIINKMNNGKNGLADEDRTRNNCMTYSQRLTNRGIRFNTLLLMISKNYAYQNNDFNNSQSIYNDVFANPNAYKIVHLTTNINNEYINYMGNYVLLENSLYKLYKKDMTLNHLLKCLLKSKLSTNNKLATAISNSINSDGILRLVLHRQHVFADNFIQIWK